MCILWTAYIAHSATFCAQAYSSTSYFILCITSQSLDLSSFHSGNTTANSSVAFTTSAFNTLTYSCYCLPSHYTPSAMTHDGSSIPACHYSTAASHSFSNSNLPSTESGYEVSPSLFFPDILLHQNCIQAEFKAPNKLLKKEVCKFIQSSC